MVLQHVRALLKADGMMTTVTPHGVLLHGRSEHEIRQSIIEENLQEAVTGLPRNPFYGTGIPASILVLWPPGVKPLDRQGRVLFINVDAECREGRARKHPMPEQIEAIATTYHELHNHERYAGAELQRQVEAEKGTGGGVPRLALFRIRNLRAACPPPEEQTRMAGVMSGQGARIRAEKATLEKLRQSKRGLMVDLLTGRVRV